MEKKSRCRWLDAGSAQCRIEQATSGQGNVPDDFPFDPETGPAGQQAVVGVALQRLRSDVAALLVGGGGHDQPVQSLLAPASVHEFAGQPVEQFGMGRCGCLEAEILRCFQKPGAKIRLPDAIDGDPRGRRRFPVHQPFCEGQPRVTSPFRKRMQKGRNAWADFLGGLEPVPPVEPESLAHLVAGGFVLAGHQRGSGRSLRPLVPQRLDLFVRFLELRNCCPPIAEDDRQLRRRALPARHLCEDLPHLGWQGIRDRVCRFANTDAEAPEIVGLVVVGVVPAVVLSQVELQEDAMGKRQRLVRNENRLARDVASARPGFDAPGSVRVAVDGEGHWPVGPFVSTLGLTGVGLKLRFQ